MEIASLPPCNTRCGGLTVTIIPRAISVLGWRTLPQDKNKIRTRKEEVFPPSNQTLILVCLELPQRSCRIWCLLTLKRRGGGGGGAEFASQYFNNLLLRNQKSDWPQPGCKFKFVCRHKVYVKVITNLDHKYPEGSPPHWALNLM